MATAFGWLDGSDTSAISISAGASLRKSTFAFPPRNAVVFEVALAVEYDNEDGEIEADFASGNFKIACPVVVFSLLDSPLNAVV